MKINNNNRILNLNFLSTQVVLKKMFHCTVHHFLFLLILSHKKRKQRWRTSISNHKRRNKTR